MVVAESCFEDVFSSSNKLVKDYRKIDGAKCGRNLEDFLDFY